MEIKLDFELVFYKKFYCSSLEATLVLAFLPLKILYSTISSLYSNGRIFEAFIICYLWFLMFYIFIDFNVYSIYSFVFALLMLMLKDIFHS